MHAKLENLNTALQNDHPCYWLHTDDLQQQMDAADIITAHYTKASFQRVKTTVDAHFDWQAYQNQLLHADLFAPKRFFHLHNPSSTWPNDAKKMLQRFDTAPPPAHRLLITSAKLTTAQTRAKWLTAASTHTWLAAIYPLKGAAWKQWIKKKAQAMKLVLKDEALAALMHLTEGNTTACHQALERLQLLNADNAIDAGTVLRLCSDQSQYALYQLTEALYAGDAHKALHLLDRLQAHAAEPALLLWHTAQGLRDLIPLQQRMLQQGAHPHSLVQSAWRSKQASLEHALNSMKLEDTQAALQRCRLLDAAFKGAYPVDFWLNLKTLVLHLSARIPHTSWLPIS
jgi:DNA polymerase III subunit delta